MLGSKKKPTTKLNQRNRKFEANLFRTVVCRNEMTLLLAHEVLTSLFLSLLTGIILVTVQKATL